MHLTLKRIKFNFSRLVDEDEVTHQVELSTMNRGK